MTREEVADAAARAFSERVTSALTRQPRFAVAVPGGSVATIVLPRFAGLDLDWSRLDVTLVDERVVPASDPESNLRVVTSAWLSRVDDGARVIAPQISAGPPADVARRWQADLVAALGAPPRLDLAVLGMGPDGHVASLFPNHASSAARGAWAVGVSDSPKPPPLRVTLTLDTLAAAHEIWVVAFGREKADAVREARSNPDSRLPVALATRARARVQWFVDDAAEGR